LALVVVGSFVVTHIVIVLALCVFISLVDWREKESASRRSIQTQSDATKEHYREQGSCATQKHRKIQSNIRSLKLMSIDTLISKSRFTNFSLLCSPLHSLIDKNQTQATANKATLKRKWCKGKENVFFHRQSFSSAKTFRLVLYVIGGSSSRSSSS